MIALLLEIKKENGCNTGFYNPAPEGCRAYPRTIDGVKRAVKKLIKTAESLNDITDYRILAYNGKKEHYKNAEFVGYIDINKFINNF